MTVFFKVAPFLIEPSSADRPPIEGGGTIGPGGAGANGGGGGAKDGGGGAKDGVGGAWGGGVGGMELEFSCAAELFLGRVLPWSLSFGVDTIDDLDLFNVAFLKM